MAADCKDCLEAAVLPPQVSLGNNVCKDLLFSFLLATGLTELGGVPLMTKKVSIPKNEMQQKSIHCVNLLA